MAPSTDHPARYDNGTAPVTAITALTVNRPGPFHRQEVQRIALTCLALGLFSATSRIAGAATIDVTPGMAAAKGGSGARALQKLIDQSSPGDTIRFGPGVYHVATTVVFKSGRDYTGEGATLRWVGADGFAGCTEYDRGKDLTITGLAFEGAGFAFTGSGKIKASRIRIRHCSFVNIRQKKYPFDVAVYIPIGASHCEFADNHFRHVKGDNGFATWNLDHSRIIDNDFDDVNECMHLNGVTTDCQVLRNRGLRTHRMGIEIQGCGNANLAVEDNHFADWDAPFHDSFGLSIVPSSGPNISVRYNTVLARPPVPGKWTSRFGFGIELGSDVLCRDNLTEGYWWIGIVIGGKKTTVTHNVLRGPDSGDYTTPSRISLEPGSEKATDIMTDNLQVVTASYIENPTALTAKTAAGRIELSWQMRAKNILGFKVERRKPGGDYATIATLGAATTTFRDDRPDAGQDYVYRIRAFNAAGDFTYSPSLLAPAEKPQP